MLCAEVDERQSRAPVFGLRASSHHGAQRATSCCWTMQEVMQSTSGTAAENRGHRLEAECGPGVPGTAGWMTRAPCAQRSQSKYGRRTRKLMVSL